MNDPIRGYALATVGLASGAGAAGLLASELRQLIGVLESADELQWALTDTSIPVAGRRAIVEELLTGKIDDLAVRLVSFVVGADKSIETLPNLRSAIGFVEEVSATEAAGVADADHVADFVIALPEELIGNPVGRQGTRDRVGGFAAAVFAQVHSEGRIGEVEDELFRLARIVQGNREFRLMLADWNIPGAERARIVTDLLSSKADPVTVALAAYALRAGNVGNLVALLDWLVERAATERNGRVGEVRSAVPLPEDQRVRMETALRRAVGHDVELRVVVDPLVIGGAQVTVGEMVVDGTVKRKLEETRQSLLDAGIGR